jgi:hypothetical protein
MLSFPIVVFVYPNAKFRTPDVVLFKDLSMSKIRTIIPINKKVVFLQE